MRDATEWLPSLWRDTFEELVDDEDELEYEDQWTLNFNYGLTDEVTAEEKRRGWKVFSPCATGGFQCASCHKTWHSARVVLLFRYRLRSEAGRGTVIMRPFKQACRSCSHPEFELPGFSNQEVERVLLRLLGKIRKNCYGEEEDGQAAPCEIQKKTKPHLKDLCEGCQTGICCEEQ